MKLDFLCCLDQILQRTFEVALSIMYMFEFCSFTYILGCWWPSKIIINSHTNFIISYIFNCEKKRIRGSENKSG